MVFISSSQIHQGSCTSLSGFLYKSLIMSLRKSSLKIPRVCCFQPHPKDSWEAPLRPCSCLEHLAAPPIPPGWAVKVLLHQNPQLTRSGSLPVGHPFARARAVCHQGWAGKHGLNPVCQRPCVWVWIQAWCYEESDFFLQLLGVDSYSSLKAWNREQSAVGPGEAPCEASPSSVCYKSSKVLFLFISILNQGGHL